MQIYKSIIATNFTLREIQSLLIVLRKVNHPGSVCLRGLPEGVRADMRFLLRDIEETLNINSIPYH